MPSRHRAIFVILLLALAAHEVTHIAYDWHDEGFANLFTDIVTACMKSVQQIHKEMNQMA